MGMTTETVESTSAQTAQRAARTAAKAAGRESVAKTPNLQPAVLIMARAPRRGEVRRALEPVLGRDGCLALQSALIAEAVRWAQEVAPTRVHIAHDPPDANQELRTLLGCDVALFPQNGDGITGRLADAVGRVFARGEGPLLIVW